MSRLIATLVELEAVTWKGPLSIAAGTFQISRLKSTPGAK
jgi:hypothetical protein